MARQELAKSKKGRALSAVEGEIAPVAGLGMFRFYYSDQEYECTLPDWEASLAKFQEDVKCEHEQVLEAGGLFIIGMERHESRRVDNQLRGRAGRQGDPGAARFYLSLEDDLMRIFARDWVSTLLQSLGMEEGVPIESGMITKRIAAAQKAVETQNFESRKHVLEYDDVMNKQRVAVYGLRHNLLQGIDQKELILEDYTATALSNIMDEMVPVKIHADQWNITAMKERLVDIFGTDFPHVDFSALNRHELGDTVFDGLKQRYEIKEKILGETQMRYHERIVTLSVLDGLWKDHLLAMDHLKEGIGLRGYAQQDPLVAYKKESFEMFEGMMQRFQEDTARHLYRMQIIGPDGQPIESVEQLAAAQQVQQQPPAAPASPQIGTPQRPVVPVQAPSTTIDRLERELQKRKERARQADGAPHRSGERVGRNADCPCGSGKKYKRCHGL